MIESLTEYWYMWLVLAVLIVIFVVVAGKASKAVKKRSAAMKQQQEFAERFKFLVEKYKSLALSAALEADASELAEGVTAVLQYSLEKSENPDEEYKNALQWKREVYALYYFAEDCRQSLSYFFKNNGEPLPSVLIGALKSIGADNIYSMTAQMYSMYDENNENVSIDKNRIEQLNKKFKDTYNETEFFELVKKYVLASLAD